MANEPAVTLAAEMPAKPEITISVKELITALPDTESRNALVKSLVETDIANRQFNADYRLARMLAASGQFSDTKNLTPDQAVATAMAKVQLGRGWGLSPTDSIRHIYFTNGRPALENEVVASKMRDAGLDWDITWHEVTEDHKGTPVVRCVGCTLWLKVWSDEEKRYVPKLDRDGSQVSASFTEA